VAPEGVDGAPVAVSFGDQGVAVVSLLAGDIESTRLWVQELLGPLAVDRPGAEALRETLRVFFATGESYARTAELLSLHRNTVKYRVAKAFGERGEGREADRMDLAVALQVCRFLGPAVLARPLRSPLG
jgi:DNA-binding PucR family transcriptional regulator